MASRPFGSGSDASNYGTLAGPAGGFNSSSRDVSNFTRLNETVSNSVMSIKQNTQFLRSMEKQIGTSSDSQEVRRRIQSMIRSTLSKVETSKQQLIELMQTARRTGDKRQQLAANSVQQNLNSAAKSFNAVAEQLLEKLQHVELPRMSTPSVSGYLDSGELDIHGDTAQLMRSQQKQTQDLVVSTEASYLEERAERMEDLEHDITQLHDIMRDIGQMVVVQGEQIDTIERHTEQAAGNVTEANIQLDHAVKLKRCSRKLMCIIACIVGGVATLILIVIIIIIAIVVPKNK